MSIVSSHTWGFEEGSKTHVGLIEATIVVVYETIKEMRMSTNKKIEGIQNCTKTASNDVAFRATPMLASGNGH